ncbi:MAG: heme-binding protein [Lewinellaceae bacterium]|nr:heme-binding protein [Lewinellaceae bacterium]
MWYKIIPAALLLLFVGYQAYAFMARDTTPTRPYRVIQKLGTLEIRFYPPAITATVHKTGDYRDNMSAGFRDLASYIFGGNDREEKIAMTSPVISVPDSTGTDISFVMPEGFELQGRPTPTRAPNIVFQETAPVYTASLTFGGFAKKADMDRKTAELLAALKAQGLTPSGPVQHLYYNAPFDLFGRKNEVLVAIEGFTE